MSYLALRYFAYLRLSVKEPLATNVGSRQDTKAQRETQSKQPSLVYPRAIRNESAI